MNYEYYHYTNKIYENKVIEKMNEIEELNKKLENFLIQEFKDEKSFFSINISQIKYKIQENSSLVKEINAQRNLNSEIFSRVICQSNNKIIDSMTDEMIDLLNKKMEDLYKQDISQFLYNISFVSSEDVISYNRPFYVYTFNYITDLFQNKNVNELIEDLDNQSLKKKKHKKKKKKNKDNKEETKNIEIKTNEKKEISEDNIINNKNEEKIEDNNLIINNESVLENNDKKKKKHKNHKKEFFLYPTNQSKKKKEEHKKNEIENNQIDK